MNNRETTLSALRRSCAVSRNVCYACLVLTVLLALLVGLFLVPVANTDRALLATLVGETGMSVVGTTVHAVALLAITALALLRGAWLFGDIAEKGDPFRPEQARAIRGIARILVVLSFAPPLLGSLAELVAGNAENVTVHLAVDLGILALALFLGALARVFEYGCILQEEDDGLV